MVVRIGNAPTQRCHEIKAMAREHTLQKDDQGPGVILCIVCQKYT